MRRTAFSSIAGAFVLLASTQAHAQPLAVGFRAGMNSGSAIVDPEIALNARVGILIGAFINYQILQGLSAQAEVRYTQRGARLALPTPIGFVRGTYSLDFVQIPFVFKGSYGDTPVRAFVVAGPSLGLLFSARGTGSIAEQDTTADLTNDFQSTEFSLEIGGGTEIDLSPTLAVAADVRYAFGLTDNIKTSNFAITLNEMKLNDVKLSAAVIFKL